MTRDLSASRIAEHEPEKLRKHRRLLAVDHETSDVAGACPDLTQHRGAHVGTLELGSGEIDALQLASDEHRAGEVRLAEVRLFEAALFERYLPKARPRKRRVVELAFDETHVVQFA